MKSDISIACTSSKGSTTDLAFDLEGTSPTLLRPGRPLAVGESCVITGRSCGFDAPPSGRDYLQGRAEFRVSEAAALPATLGTLQVQPAKVEELEFAGGASCGERHQVCAVRLSVVLSNEAKPWKDALIYTTFIQESQFSGQGWSLPDPEIGLPTPAGGSYIGRGQDLLYYALDDVNPQGLTRGKHRVSMHATLAGTDVMIETPLQDVSLDCGTLGSNARSLFASGSNSACTVTDVRSSVTGARCWFALLVLIAFLRRVSARAARV